MIFPTNYDKQLVLIYRLEIWNYYTTQAVEYASVDVKYYKIYGIFVNY